MAERLPRMPGGLLVPSRLTWEALSDALSSYTEGDPMPGIAVPVTEGAEYRVQVTGGQGAPFEVRAIRSGPPGRLSVAYRLEGETDDDWRGWQQPTVLECWRSIQISGTATFRRHDIVILPDTQTPVIIRRASNDRTVRARRFDLSDMSIGDTGAIVGAAASDPWQFVAACVIPDDAAMGGGRILLLYRGKIWTSVDGGDTWDQWSDFPFEADISDFGRVRLEHHRGEILCVVQDTSAANKVWQFASSDGGVTFDLVAEISGFGHSIDTTTTPDAILVAVVEPGDQTVRTYRLPSAYTSLQSVGHAAASGILSCDSGALAVASDPDGTVWATISQPATTRKGRASVLVSLDGGRTWARGRGLTYLGVPSGGDPVHLRGLSMASCQGRLLLLHSWVEGAASIDGGLGLAVYGGHANLMSGPPEGGPGWGYHERLGSAGWDPDPTTGSPAVMGWVVLPLDHPEEWDRIALATSGTHSASPGGLLDISTTSGIRRYTYDVDTLDIVDMMTTFEVFVVSGGSKTSTACAVQLIVSDGTDEWIAIVSLAHDGFTARDGETGAVIAQVDTDMSDPVQIAALLTATGDLTVAWRRPGDTVWAVIVADESVTKRATPAFTKSTLRFGHLSSGTASSAWRSVTCTHGNILTVRLRHGVTQLLGRTLTGLPIPLPEPATDTGHVPWLRAVSGTARRGEVLRLPIASGHGISRAFPAISPSPYQAWQTEPGDEGEQIIAFDFGHSSTIGGYLGLAILRANFRRALLEYSSNGSTWTEAGELDLGEEFEDLLTRRTGDVLGPFAGSDPAQRYLWSGELVGGSVDLDGRIRRIVDSAPGAWTMDHTTARAHVRIELRGGEPSSAAGDPVTLIHHSGVLCVPLTAALSRRYWRIRIPAQTTPDGYLRAGVIMAGRIQPWGAEVDPSLSDTYTPNVASSRSRWGTSRLRELGPIARTWRLGWTDGVERGRLRAGLGVDYIGVEGGLALHAGEDVDQAVVGLLRELRSGQIPGVVIEPLPETAQTITDPTKYLYCRLMGGISADQMALDPNTVLEWVRVEGLTAEEVV